MSDSHLAVAHGKGIPSPLPFPLPTSKKPTFVCPSIRSSLSSTRHPPQSPVSALDAAAGRTGKEAFQGHHSFMTGPRLCRRRRDCLLAFPAYLRQVVYINCVFLAPDGLCCRRNASRLSGRDDGWRDGREQKYHHPMALPGRLCKARQLDLRAHLTCGWRQGLRQNGRQEPTATVARGASAVVCRRCMSGVGQLYVIRSACQRVQPHRNCTAARPSIPVSRLLPLANRNRQQPRVWSELCFLVLPYYMRYLTACASGRE